MSFLFDKKRGEIAEKIVEKILTPQLGWKHSVGKNAEYDFINDASKQRIEVKFDIKSYETGNLCFEYSNGKKLTGIFASKSNEVWYVIPTDKKNEYEIIKFNIPKLVKFLQADTANVRSVQGGDGKRFSLLLVKKDFAKKYGEVVKWVEPQD